MTPCPSKDELHKFVTEHLPSEAAAAVEGHVETCVHCQAVLSSLSRSHLPKAQRDHLRTLLAGRPNSPAPTIPGIELVAVVGQGSIGRVWEGPAKGTGATRGRQDAAGPTWTTRAFRSSRAEAEALAHLDHPNVVRVYQSGPTSDGYYFAMEYLPSGSLVDDRARRPTLWEPRAVAKLVRDSALAVQAAHECKILHRDLKPGNILITETERRRWPTSAKPRRSAAASRSPANRPERRVTWPPSKPRAVPLTPERTSTDWGLYSTTCWSVCRPSRPRARRRTYSTGLELLSRFPPDGSAPPFRST